MGCPTALIIPDCPNEFAAQFGGNLLPSSVKPSLEKLLKIPGIVMLTKWQSQTLLICRIHLL